jgi:hypothetical protein
MMRDVASDDESESAHGEGFAVRDAVSRPRGGRQILEQANRGEANEAKLFDVIEPRNSIGPGTLRADVLVVAGKRRFESSRKPVGAKSKGAFGVGDVIENLANGPFIRGVAVKRRLFCYAGKKFEGIGQLFLYRDERVIAGYLIDVGEIVRSGFGIFRAAKHGGNVSQVGSA